MALRGLQQPGEGRVVDRAAVEREPRAQPVVPLGVFDRGELVQGAELAERAIARREEVAHDVFDGAGEQDADVRRALEDSAHLPRQHARVAVEAAGHLLELVEEEDEPPVVGRGDPLGQLPSRGERARRVGVGTGHRQGELEVIAEVLSRPA